MEASFLRPDTVPVSTDGTNARADGPSQASVFAVLLAGAVLVLLVLEHVDGVNGPRYWPWPWHSTGWSWRHGVTLYAPALLAFAASQLLVKRTMVQLALLVVCAGLLTYAAQEVLTSQPAIHRASAVLRSPLAHGYYSDFVRVEKQKRWLGRFDELTPGFQRHSSTKGPGAFLFYRFLSAVVGPGRDPTRLAAVTLGVLSLLGIPLVFLMARTVGVPNRAAIAAASMFAISPALGVFWPSFDAVYPAVTCLLVIAWHRALATNHAWYSLGFGLALAVTLLFTYNLLALGSFFVAHGALWVRAEARANCEPWYRSLGRPGGHAGAALTALVVFYGALYLATGFDPVATFRTALRNQSSLLTVIPRPYPATVVFDVLDLALGLAWLPMILATMAAIAAAKDPWRERSQLVLLCVAPPVLVALLALLPGETARVMLFMGPLVLVPAGLHLADWRRTNRFALYVIAFVLSVAISRSILFVLP